MLKYKQMTTEFYVKEDDKGKMLADQYEKVVASQPLITLQD